MGFHVNVNILMDVSPFIMTNSLSNTENCVHSVTLDYKHTTTVCLKG